MDPVVRPVYELDSDSILELFPEMPLWVKNPDYDRVDWMNKFLSDMWPYLDKVKWPGGKRFEYKFVETLIKYGYKGSYMSKEWLKEPVFIQSFAPSSLVYISNMTDSPKIFLIDDVTMPTQDTNQEYVVGIGPWKDSIVPVVDGYCQTPTDLVARAHAHDLQVHPYTYRNENVFLHLNFNQDPYQGYDYWFKKIGVDGLFTDFTGSLHHYQEWASPLSG